MMDLAGIEVRMRVTPQQTAYLAELEMTGDSTEVMEVTLRFAATRGEVATVGAMLVSGQRPPREFWDALDWGDVKKPCMYDQPCQEIGHPECLYKEDCKPPIQPCPPTTHVCGPNGPTDWGGDESNHVPPAPTGVCCIHGTECQ